MHRRVTSLCALLVACSSSTSPNDAQVREDSSTLDPDATSGSSDGGVSTIDGGPPPPLPEAVDCTAEVARFAGVVTSLEARTPLVGARVCVDAHPEIPCATTDANGFYELSCAPIGDAAIHFDAAGYAEGVWLWAGAVSAMPISLDVSLARMADNTTYLEPTGMVYPDDGDSLVTIDLNGNVAGLTARLVTGSGVGPYYSVDEGGRIDPTLSSASSDRELMFFVARPFSGWSDVEIALNATTGQCGERRGAWRG
jgi:hypothetical protein